jgi:hypothetical protein
LDLVAAVLDRGDECARVLDAIGSHSRILISGDLESGVPEFASWLAVRSAEGRKVILWDFETAPGVEGIDILGELKKSLPSYSHIDEEYEKVKAEYFEAPFIQASQSVAEQASAGHDQTITAEMIVPTWPSHLVMSLHRLAMALFEDIKSAYEQQPILLMFSGVTLGSDNPVPTERVLNMIKSSVWRLAKTCPPDKLCVVLAATVMSPGALGKLEPCFQCPLGRISHTEAAASLSERVPDLSCSEATAILQSMSPIAEGVQYTELQKRVLNLQVNRLEPEGQVNHE